MIIKKLVIKYKPLFSWSRSYDLYVLGTRINELIDSNNDIESRLKKLEGATAPKPD